MMETRKKGQRKKDGGSRGHTGFTKTPGLGISANVKELKKENEWGLLRERGGGEEIHHLE